LVKRRTAEEMGAILVEQDGRPSHFELRCSSSATSLV
jgi:hypothetical protein